MYEKLLTVFAVMAGVVTVAEIARWTGCKKRKNVITFNGSCVSFCGVVVLVVLACNLGDMSVRFDVRYIVGMVVTVLGCVLHFGVALHGLEDRDFGKSCFSYKNNLLTVRKAYKNREIARNDILTCKTVLTDLENGVYVVDGRQKTITLDEFNDFLTAICSQTDKLQDSYYCNCKTKPKEKLKQAANIFLALVPLYVAAACTAVVVYALT